MSDCNSVLRQKYPSKARAADHERSRTEAINLKCLDCANGGREEVRNCPAITCFLWPYRPYAEAAEKIRPEGSVPTAEEYGIAIEASGRTGNPDGGAVLKAWRENRTLEMGNREEGE